jgi:hypothetical protein
MNVHTSTLARRPLGMALSGVLFAVLFLLSDTVAGRLTTAALPMPNASVADVIAYYRASQGAVVVLSTFHMLAALALVVFTRCVVQFMRRMPADRGIPVEVTEGAGILAGLFLLASALLGLAAAQAAPGGDPALMGTLRP